MGPPQNDKNESLFKPVAQLKSAPALRWHRGLLRAAVGLGIVGLAALVVAGLLSYERPTLSVEMDRLEGQVKTSLAHLTHVPTRDATGELRGFRRMLQKRTGRLQRCMQHVDARSLTDVDRDRLDRARDELARLKGRVQEWEARLRETPKTRREEVWIKTMVEVLGERNRWPIAGVVRAPTSLWKRHLWSDLEEGVGIGVLWPVRAVVHAVGKRPAGYGRVRYMLFPYGRTALRSLHVVGFGLISIGLGYGLCWIGMRLNNAQLSYMGLIYFIYVIVFATCLMNQRLGVLS
jgi:BMFP domain-containing protein YqiC